MSDIQFYMAIGIPSGLFALNFIAILWQARGLTTRIDSLERSHSIRIDGLERSLVSIMEAKFETSREQLLRVEQVLDARLKHLEEAR